MTCTSFSIDPGVPANDRLPRKPWTAEEDRFLIEHGRILGYGWVATRLGHTDSQGWSRVKYLRIKSPDLFVEFPKPVHLTQGE